MEIGGYFELELSCGEHYHKNALRLNTASSCLEYILRCHDYRKVYVPYFTCETVVRPFKLLHIDYEFYAINEKLEPVSLPILKDNEAFLYTNYFGLKQDCVERLAAHLRDRLIVDNAQAFYDKPITGVDTFYSARKFFGVPDGAYLYCEKKINEPLKKDTSYHRMGHLLKRIDLGAEAGYGDFRLNDDTLAEQPLMHMSSLTERLLGSINYQSVKDIRRDNYRLLENGLGKINQLDLNMSNDEVPMVYPFMTDNANLKTKLIKNKIFVATYWPNIFEWCNNSSWEFQLAEKGCFLPVDQRYGEKEMKRIIEVILG